MSEPSWDFRESLPLPLGAWVTLTLYICQSVWLSFFPFRNDPLLQSAGLWGRAVCSFYTLRSAWKLAAQFFFAPLLYYYESIEVRETVCISFLWGKNILIEHIQVHKLEEAARSTDLCCLQGNVLEEDPFFSLFVLHAMEASQGANESPLCAPSHACRASLSFSENNRCTASMQPIRELQCI